MYIHISQKKPEVLAKAMLFVEHYFDFVNRYVVERNPHIYNPTAIKGLYEERAKFIEYLMYEDKRTLESMVFREVTTPGVTAYVTYDKELDKFVIEYNPTVLMGLFENEGKFLASPEDQRKFAIYTAIYHELKHIIEYDLQELDNILKSSSSEEDKEFRRDLFNYVADVYNNYELNIFNGATYSWGVNGSSMISHPFADYHPPDKVELFNFIYSKLQDDEGKRLLFDYLFSDYLEKYEPNPFFKMWLNEKDPHFIPNLKETIVELYFRLIYTEGKGRGRKRVKPKNRKDVSEIEEFDEEKMKELEDLAEHLQREFIKHRARGASKIEVKPPKEKGELIMKPIRMSAIRRLFNQLNKLTTARRGGAYRNVKKPNTRRPPEIRIISEKEIVDPLRSSFIPTVPVPYPSFSIYTFIDLSGSMGVETNVKKIMGRLTLWETMLRINKAVKRFVFKTFFFSDACIEVKEGYEKDAFKQLAGGGTQFRPCAQRIFEDRNKIDAVVILSDMAIVDHGSTAEILRKLPAKLRRNFIIVSTQAGKHDIEKFVRGSLGYSVESYEKNIILVELAE